MRKSSKGTKGPLKLEQVPASAGVDDVKVKAVNEMMERIKHGVVLRPVKGQDTKVVSLKRFGIKQPPATEERQQESAMEELKGILETVKKSPSRGFPEVVPGKKDSELEVILRRRRKQACDAGSGEEDGQISKVSSSESLNARHSSDSGKEPSRSRRSSDSGRDPAGSGRSSDSGSRESSGVLLGDSGHSSSSERGAPEFHNGNHNSGEEEKRKWEKCTQSNGVDHTVLNQDKHATFTSGSLEGTSPLNGGTDAEC